MDVIDFLRLNITIVGIIVLIILIYLIVLINKRRRQKFLHEKPDEKHRR